MYRFLPVAVFLPVRPPSRGGSFGVWHWPNDRRPLATVICHSSPISPAQQSATTPWDSILGSSSQASVCKWSTTPLGLPETDWGDDLPFRLGMRKRERMSASNFGLRRLKFKLAVMSYMLKPHFFVFNFWKTFQVLPGTIFTEVSTLMRFGC